MGKVNFSERTYYANPSLYGEDNIYYYEFERECTYDEDDESISVVALNKYRKLGDNFKRDYLKTLSSEDLRTIIFEILGETYISKRKNELIRAAEAAVITRFEEA